MLTKKDITALNEVYDTGTVINDASLDFALSYAKKTENWVKALAWIMRAILLDHVFEEGNKRTAALLIKTYADFEGHEIYDDILVKSIKEILTKNRKSITTIERMINNAIK